jgi:hypothetical protein
MGKITITESGMDFGKFDEDNLFYVEKSDLYKSLGLGIKTVEFVTLQGKDNIIFVEAKTGCPNPANKGKGGEDAERFNSFYDDIADKFVDSLQVYMAGVMENYTDTDEIGNSLKNIKPLKSKHLKFVLVITSDEILEDWLRGPKLELEERLKKAKKIWDVNIVVLNRKMAIEYGISGD